MENWPDKVKIMQKNWIGKSLGCEIKFNLIDSEEKLTVFTTRPDTIFGATFIAVSADHPICKKFKDNKDFEEFKKNALKLEQLKKLWLMQKKTDLILLFMQIILSKKTKNYQFM